MYSISELAQIDSQHRLATTNRAFHVVVAAAAHHDDGDEELVGVAADETGPSDRL
jgi:hypothetical protein